MDAWQWILVAGFGIFVLGMAYAVFKGNGTDDE